MTGLTGSSLIGLADVHRSGDTFRAADPALGVELDPAYGEAGLAEIDRAAELAQQAFAVYRTTAAEQRAAFLDTIAANIEGLGATLSDRVTAETGLPAGRVAGEAARTVGQLRLFASVVRDGGWRQICVEPALPDRAPLPRPDLRQRTVPVGPVVVFAASNFPLAFSVAGGDTASALAAGCPVIVKAHPAHPGTSELVGRAVRDAVTAHRLPEGTFSVVQGTSHELGTALVTDPRVQAVGFTGSRGGGLALVGAAQQRHRPIPVYAEMSAVNPVVVLPAALSRRATSTASAYIAAVTGSAGQLCTKPGLLLLLDGPDVDSLIDAAAQATTTVPAVPMLTNRISTGYGNGVDRLAGTAGVTSVGRGLEDDTIACPGVAELFVTTGTTLLTEPHLTEEVFGPTSLIVRVRDERQLTQIIDTLGGQLTATVHLTDADHPLAERLLARLEMIAGRVIVNGWPTGVEVGHAMVHGGPFPATSAPATTSVGSRALERFLRPVAYQSVPVALLPIELRSDGPDPVDGARDR